MNDVYKEILNFCIVYINDVLVFSLNEEEHVDHLQKFKDHTSMHGLALSKYKMKIGHSEKDFLGL